MSQALDAMTAVVAELEATSKAASVKLAELAAKAANPEDTAAYQALAGRLKAANDELATALAAAATAAAAPAAAPPTA